MNRRTKIIIATVIAVAAVSVFLVVRPHPKIRETAIIAIHPVKGNIVLFVSTTGTIKPKNRLEIIPSVSGRIEKVLVEEGNTVRLGQIIAWMSSADRAAMIDAARAQGADAVRYWEDVYKPIPIVSPITGTVIARSVEPGQTVTTSTVCIVISDRLEAVAQVDETDIAKIRVGQKAEISLDSHPDVIVNGKVSAISYESTTVNNVTTYNVFVVPDTIPAEFRSGMSANINFEDKSRHNVIVIPNDAIITHGDSHTVFVQGPQGIPPQSRDICIGISDEKFTEVISGLDETDSVVVSKKKFIIPKQNEEKNMFMPTPPRGKK
jgi:macrolide-specific efflux system membrane fusion protein